MDRIDAFLSTKELRGICCNGEKAEENGGFRWKDDKKVKRGA